MVTFLYPKDILQQLRDAWSVSSWREGEIPPLPDDITLQAILEVVYHASFTADEQRATRFSIALCGPEETWQPIQFGQSREFSAQELMRLAPAGDIESLAIGVDARGPDKPRIWGLASSPRANHPMISAYAPGSIEVRRNSRAIIALRLGTITTAPTTITDEFVADIFADAFHALWEGVDWPLGNAVPIHAWCSLPFVDLLQKVAQHGHGGSIFVLPERLVDAPTWRKHVRIKYTTDDAGVWPALREIVLRTKPEDTEMNHTFLRTIIRKIGFRDNPANSTTNQADSQSVSQSVERFARLTRVDGAILLTDRFRLLGFGVEAVGDADVESVRIAGGGSEPIDNYGTRHRSAVRFCHHCPEAVAFVCSQDGGVKCLRSEGGGVTLWK